jgi:DeoR family fructose operon transcriptional repressor
MFVEERHREIIKILRDRGKVKTLQLAEMLGVSEPTIRRDIAELDKRGELIRTHGGALPIEENDAEPTFLEKSDKYLEEKVQIGKVAASLVKSGSTIVLDGGTTTLQIAKHLSGEKLTVITNALDIAESLEENGDIDVILTGGTIRWNTRALVGPITEAVLKQFRVDMAFVGINAISAEGGVMTPNLIEASSKKAMLEIAHRAFVVADHTKFNKRALCKVAAFSDLEGIITDAGIDESLIHQYEQMDVELILKEGDFVDSNGHPESSS